MPPHLRKGVARQQHIQQFPPTEHFCSCYECCNSLDIDRSTGTPIKGRYVSQAQWKDHQQKEIKSGIASSRLAAAALEIQGQLPDALPLPLDAVNMFPVMRNLSTHHQPPLEEHVSSSSAPSPPASPHQSKGKRSRGEAKDLDDRARSFRAMKLTEVRKRLDGFGVGDLEETVRSSPLVFVLDPSRQSNQSSLRLLDEDAPANSAVIEYREWLRVVQAFIVDNSFETQRDSVHVRLQSRVVLDHVKREALALAELQNHELERQQAAGPGPQINSLDTGMFGGFFLNVTYVTLKIRTQLAMLQGLSARPNQLP